MCDCVIVVRTEAAQLLLAPPHVLGQRGRVDGGEVAHHYLAGQGKDVVGRPQLIVAEDDEGRDDRARLGLHVEGALLEAHQLAGLGAGALGREGQGDSADAVARGPRELLDGLVPVGAVDGEDAVDIGHPPHEGHEEDVVLWWVGGDGVGGWMGVLDSVGGWESSIDAMAMAMAMATGWKPTGARTLPMDLKNCGYESRMRKPSRLEPCWKRRMAGVSYSSRRPSSR